MKKRDLCVAAALLALAFPSRAQEAFNSLSFGLEIGTTGVGVELAMPLVTDHLVVAAGFNAPFMTYAFSRSVSAEACNASIDHVNSQLESIGAVERVDYVLPDAELQFRPVLNLSTAKLMLEYYPFRKSSFHITAGAYFGMGENFMSITATADRIFWAAYNAVHDEIAVLNQKYGDTPGYEARNLAPLQYSAGDRTFAVTDKDGAGYSDAVLHVAKVRPYLGLGFGRSVPKSRFGFQVDVGVWYHGVPALSSDCEVEYNPDADSLLGDISLLDRLVLFPQLSLRLIYKIF